MFIGGYNDDINQQKEKINSQEQNHFAICNMSNKH